MSSSHPSVSSRGDYPGSNASVREILALANSYYQAAIVLFRESQKKLVPLSSAPARMAAIHAIELYVNAFLRHEGAAPEEIRKRMHNLAEPTLVAKLKLRKRTALHLEEMTARREYLIARYAPERVTDHTELNRLSATLVEVMKKVGEHVGTSSQPTDFPRHPLDLKVASSDKQAL
ncbi:hypothetical protein [Neorhizobium sp. SOG26]|uniref:hypothetical protein n=1 Tax=Neorhizobium sp. SOG26 TaxID=2060726 RepID=UPI001FE168B8|nr:hypothetical protein [Neorhizobium sp. SOG26]